MKKIAALCLFLISLPLCAQNTAFTYQGRLTDGTNFATGTYNFTFSLFNAVSGGTMVAGPITNSATSVLAGLFTVQLNFGSNVFNGKNYWLQIGVVPNNGSHDFSYTTLSPRQPLLPVPYAINAGSASNLLGMLSATQVSGSIPSSQLSGTIPASKISGSIPTTQLSGTIAASQISGSIPASKISGAIPTAQITGPIAASVISGSIPSTQISGTIPASKISGTIPTTQLSGTIAASKISGAIPTTQLSGTIPATQLSGKISASMISGTIASAQLPGHITINSEVYTGNGAGLQNVNALQLGGISVGGFSQTATNTIYVSPSGNNSTGQRGTGFAFANLYAAAVAAQPGDVIYVEKGTYNEGSQIVGIPPKNLSIHGLGQPVIVYTLTNAISGLSSNNIYMEPADNLLVDGLVFSTPGSGYFSSFFGSYSDCPSATNVQISISSLDADSDGFYFEGQNLLTLTAFHCVVHGYWDTFATYPTLNTNDILYFKSCEFDVDYINGSNPSQRRSINVNSGGNLIFENCRVHDALLLDRKSVV